MGVSYNSAWSIKQRIMQVMKERDDSKVLSGVIQLDDVYWGGERHGGKSGRGSPNKTPFVTAVSVNEEGHPIHMNMSVLKGFRSKEIERWVKRHLEPGCHVVSDNLACFFAVKTAGCQHTSIVTGGGPACVSLAEFTWVNTMIGNVKNALRGAYHAISHKHLPRHLASSAIASTDVSSWIECCPDFASLLSERLRCLFDFLDWLRIMGNQETV